MNDPEIVEKLKIEIKAQDKLIKVFNRITKLPDAQRKELETMNIIGPKEEVEILALIKQHKEIKKWSRKFKEQKSADEGLSVDAMIKRMSF